MVKFMGELKELTLLHSNDMHGDFLAENVSSELVGGVSMLSGYVNAVRAEEKNVIYAVAGDMFRGSVIDSEYKGISTIEIMNLLAPDVVTVGNHEVDYGIPHLLFIEKCAKFPIINANLYIRTNHARLFKPYHIIELDGMKILFIGVLTEEVLSQTRQDELIGSFVDIDEAAREVGRICNTYNSVDVDLTVLLTHIGFEEDKALAARLDPDWGVDIIIGGHSHTLPEKPAEVNGILIAQAGTGTDRIGRFDITIDTETNSVKEYTWRTEPIDSDHCPRDTELEDIILNYKKLTDEKYGRIVTRFARVLTHPERTQETELGNLFADILRDALGIDLMLMGSGSLRLEKLGPVVRYSDFLEMFPYDDSGYMIKVTGAQLKRMLRFMLREEAWGGHTEFYQLSHGMRIVWDRAKAEFKELSLDGAAITDERVYSVGLQKYHFSNLKDFLDITLEEAEQNGKTRVLTTSCRDILEEELASGAHLARSVEGRLVVE